MKFHKQEFLYDKEKGVRGSCFPTVLACILDLELGQVPNFQLSYWTHEEEQNIIKCLLLRYCNGSYENAKKYQQDNFDNHKSLMHNQWANTMDFWLASKGYVEEYILLEEIEEWVKKNPETPYLVKGDSSRGVGHVVIYKNGKMIHDPHPSNEGLVSLREEPYSYLKKITNIKYVNSHIDEFNYIFSSNIDANLMKQKNEMSFLYTSTFSEFDIMFNEYDKIFVKKINFISGMGVIDSIAQDRSIEQKMNKDGAKKASLLNDIEFVTDQEINDLRGSQHVYKYTFSNSAKLLKEGKLKFINPKYKDYKANELLLSSLNTKNKKVVAINGRNLIKIPERNQTFQPLIDHLIKEGFFVVNLTINPPGFNYPKDSYYEITNPSLSYSDMVSFFLLSETVLSVCDSGGVNVHILTEANFIFLGPGGWLDNPEFGHEGTSLLSARKENTNFYTEHLLNFSLDELVNKIKQIPGRNRHSYFFNENKIEFI